MAIQSISVIGFGLMGTPLASFFLKAGYSVKGFDILKRRVSDLVPFGLKPASSARGAVTGAELIVLSLPNWKIVQEVVEGREGIIVENGRRLGAAVPMAALYRQMLLSAYHRGWNQKDATIVMKIFEELSGIKRKL
jgi:3-hydroxyisobutyrate dehydrogenase-like beta-hydroxyacid dehydrogenase